MENFNFKKRKELLELISEQQRDFIEHKLKRGYKTRFARFMQSEKISVIKMTDDITLEEVEQQAKDWQIVSYVDYGLGNRLGRCACGRTLRYEFIVEHVLTKKQIYYGKFHLADFLNINVSDVDTIINDLCEIDYEADELLSKIQQDNYGYEILDYLEKEAPLPEDIQGHIEHHVPLLDRQIRRLRDMINEQLKKQPTMSVTRLVTPGSFENYVNYKENSAFLEQPRETVKLSNAFLEQPRETAKLSNDRIAEIAYQLVLEGENSATTISHIIRNNYNVNKEYSLSPSRRPRIYATVLSGLHSYVKKGLIYHDQESSGIKDSYFFPNPLQ